MTDLVIRALAPGEEQLFNTLPDAGIVGRAADGQRYSADDYRPEWTWIALREGTVIARAAWWGGPDHTEPVALDWFDFTDADAAVELLRTAPFTTEYVLRIPPDFQQRPDIQAETKRRVDAATAANLDLLVERLRYRWTPDCGLSDRPGRLVFRPEPDDAAILAALREIEPGSLDAHMVHKIAKDGIDAAAKEDLELLARLPGPREWWRLAYTEGGELVGFVAPTRNYDDPIVAFVGVVAGQRGHGYAYDLLVEGTHLLVEQGADRIIASTDVTNTPMAAHFAKAGYPVRWRVVNMIPRSTAT